MNATKNTCSPGYDDISALPIKAAGAVIAAPLVHICNRMLLTGLFPDKMKIAHVALIFKGGIINDLKL